MVNSHDSHLCRPMFLAISNWPIPSTQGYVLTAMAKILAFERSSGRRTSLSSDVSEYTRCCCCCFAPFVWKWALLGILLQRKHPCLSFKPLHKGLLVC